ncbi:MAG: hypothetical protein AB7G25_19020 [Sphingomonadaceae bacterium]
MPARNWPEQALGWLLSSPDTLSVHAVLLVMFAASLLLRRSLGAWPVWWSAFFGAVLIEMCWSLSGVRHALWPVALVNTLAMPTVLFLLARTQKLPGLRRGQMSEAARKRWIATHAFAPERGDHQKGLLTFGRS